MGHLRGLLCTFSSLLFFHSVSHMLEKYIVSSTKKASSWANHVSARSSFHQTNLHCTLQFEVVHTRTSKTAISIRKQLPIVVKNSLTKRNVVSGFFSHFWFTRWSFFFRNKAVLPPAAWLTNTFPSSCYICAQLISYVEFEITILVPKAPSNFPSFTVCTARDRKLGGV